MLSPLDPMRAWALALDRLNVRVVGWRLRQDPAAHRGLVDDPGSAEQLRPVPVEDRGHAGERWRDDDGDWLADRLPPLGAPASAALVLLHGWLATAAHLSYLRQRLRPLRRAGLEVWMPRLPAHIERSPKGSVSGVRFLSGDVESTTAAVERSVRETVDLGRWLRQRVDHVALWGISLGGWIASLAVARDPSWRAAVLWSPVVDPRTAMTDSPLATPLREMRKQAGHEDAALRPEHDRLVAVEQMPCIDANDVMVISGVYDNVADKASIDTLCSRWRVRSLQLDHGHISQMMSQRAWRIGRRFIIDRVT